MPRSKYFLSVVRSTVSNEIVGLVRLERSPQLYDIMAKRCGFEDFAEVVKHYPDRMDKGSPMAKFIPTFYIWENTSRDQFPLYDHNIAYNMNDLKYLFRKYNKINIITAPKMEDMKECEGFEETPKENLWFCSDYQTV